MAELKYVLDTKFEKYLETFKNTSYDKENIIVTFLALLNMSKEKEIIIKQKANFETIYIERGNNE